MSKTMMFWCSKELKMVEVKEKTIKKGYSMDIDIFAKDLKEIEAILNRVKHSDKIEDLESLKTKLTNFKKFKKGSENNLINLTQVLNDISSLKQGENFNNKDRYSLIGDIKKLKNIIKKNFNIDDKSKTNQNQSNSFNSNNTMKDNQQETVMNKDIQNSNQLQSSKTVTDKKENSELYDNKFASKKEIKDLNKKIESSKSTLSQEIKSSKNQLIDTIKEIKFPQPQKQPTDYLKKDDFQFALDEKFNELSNLKDSAEELETVPAKITAIDKKIDELSNKMDNLPTSKSSTTETIIPKEEQAVIDLAKFMKDGISQFENISKEYISKIGDLENLEELKSKHSEELRKSKDDSFEDGKKVGEINFIKKLIEKHPSLIENLTSDYLSKRFTIDEIIEITNDNKNDLTIFIDIEIELAKYKTIKPAILLDDKVLIKAKVEKVIEKKEVEEIQEVKKNG